MSQHFGRELRQDLEHVAGGGEPSDMLMSERDDIRNSPLDETPGEAVHRDTNGTKRRACAAQLPFVKSSLRFGQNVRRCKAFLVKGKVAARQAYRFEWKNFKRVLQTSSKHKLRGIRMKTGSFFKRLYRIECYDTPDWSSAVGRLA